MHAPKQCNTYNANQLCREFHLQLLISSANNTLQTIPRFHGGSMLMWILFLCDATVASIGKVSEILLPPC